MTMRMAAGWLATALMSGGLGWAMHPSVPQAAPEPQRSPTRVAAPATQADAGATILVSGDGNVTLRVEQQPLEWVLEQIAAQSGWRDVKARAHATPASSSGSITSTAASDCAETAPLLTAAQAERLLKSIEHGSEAERYEGLLQARSDGAAVPDEMLKVLYETDASPRVRLLAFEDYLEPRSGDDTALRRALQAALYLPDEAIQREARQRLDELDESARIDASAAQQLSP